MKKLILLLLFFPFISLSQELKTEEIVITEGTNYQKGTFISIDPVVVVESEGTAQELYQKCIDWLNITYKQPEEVIKGKIEGEYVKINGAASNLIQLTTLGSTRYWDTRYTIEFRFKDGRFRMEVISFEYYQPPSQYSVMSGWFTQPLSYRIANRKGKTDKDGQPNVNRVKSYFENLAIGLRDFSVSEGMKAVNDDW